ncbi:hypothetical protein TWF173_010107 [Orbilia oligospora]|nr:hypothetical protein TWF173_010107 [Orbilia oligospora]
MQFFALSQVFVLLSILQVFMPGALCLPTAQPSTDLQLGAESPNPALEVRTSLEKRDSWDCKGSSNCGGVSANACRRAFARFLVGPDEVFRRETRYSERYDGIGLHSCLAIYTCSNPADYVSAANAGVATGRNLWSK